MATLALRLNDQGLVRLDVACQAALKEAQRSIAGARQWLRGALQEAAIGWFSRLYGLPVPAALVRALHREPAAEAAVAERRVEAALIPDEVQWVKATEIFAAATSSADAAGRLQAAAAQQIDAASYALDRLLEEIGPLMIFAREEDEKLEVRRYERRAPRVTVPKPVRQDAAETAAA
jgi:hypothetical protein